MSLAADGPWAPLLGLLPPEVGRSLGPWLDKLALAIGPLRARARTGTGAPDGFEGLSLRGPYERLVLSEWALADALPEEFMRRAAQGEHAFYQLARREEARARTSVALFDPGPLQLGGPRIGQLGALLVLAGRAREAGATFGWATLQRPPEHADVAEGLRLGLDEAGLRRFLLGRTAFAPTPADLDAWFDLARRGDWEDLWVVGAPGTVAPGRRLAGVKTPVGRIEVADVFERGARAVDLAVVRGPHRRTLRVDLPPEAECRQLLLRGGLDAPTKPPARPLACLARTPGVARPVSAPVLLADGRKVAFLDAGDCVTVYTVPDAPSLKRGRYARYTLPRDRRVLGLGWARHRLVLVSEGGGELHAGDTHGDVFRADASLRRFEAPAAWQPALRPAQLARVELVSSAGSGPPTLAFVDGGGRLVALYPDRAAVLATGVRAAVEALVAASGTFRAVMVRFARGGGPLQAPPCDPIALARAPAGDTALGLTLAPPPGQGPALLTLGADARSVGWVTAGATGRVFAVEQPAVHATATARGDRVALTLADGGVEVWSVPDGQCLLRVVAPA